MATKKSTGSKLADMMYGNPEGAAFGVYPQAGKRGQRKLTAKEQLAQIFSDDRAMELPKSGDFDLSVPSRENLDLSERIGKRQADIKRQTDEAMSPLEKLAGGMQAGRLIGSGMYQAVKSIPTAITKGGKAAEEYIAENIYKPNQPKAYEYAEDVGNFLQSLESDYKIPPIIPQAMALQNVIGPATRQAGRAAQQGAKQGALNLMAPNTLNPQAGVIKMKGGNWLGGSIEKALEDLKRPDRATGSRKDPKESMAEMKATYTPEALSVMSPETQAHVARAMDDLERKIALNNWVDSNLYGYIKNDMATPQDPVRLMIERRMAEIDQKFAKDMERVSRVEQRAAAETDPRRKANFDRQAQTARAEAQAERDTAMKYASHMPQNEIDYANQWIPEDLALSRMNAGFPTEGLGQSNTAKGWEAITDSYIHSAPAGNYTKPLTDSEVRRGFTSVVDDNPWLSKLDPDTQVQYLKNADSILQDLRLDHIMDVLREDVATGRIRPEQLSKVSMEQAVRRTAEYDQELAKKMRETAIKQQEGFPLYKEYPEGYRWIELTIPEVSPERMAEGDPKAIAAFLEQKKQMGMTDAQAQKALNLWATPQEYKTNLEQALKYEGDTMGHCVGGYCPDVLEGKSRIYSLRDARGEPHVTIEAAPPREPGWAEAKQAGGDPRAIQDEAMRRMGLDPNSADENRDIVKNWDGDTRHAKQQEMNRHFADIYREQFGEPPQRIVQIKGKQNKAPVESYLPFVQDFVRSGKWSDVGDLQNTGLVRKSDLIDKFSPDELDSIGVGEYLTKGEQDDLLLKALNARSPGLTDELGLTPPEGMAHGGRVHISDDLDVMQLELAGGGLVKKAVKAATKAVKGTQDILPAAERESNKAKFLEGSAIKDRVHHGTNNDIRKFNDKKLGLNTDSNASSEGYAQTARVGHWFNTKPMGQTPEEYGAGYTVDMPVHLSIKNPKRELSLDWLAQGLESKKGRAYRRELEEQGYDGIVLPDEEFGGESWVAFRPEQIKSAIGNRGTYDIEDPDINKADGGAVQMAGGGALAKMGAKGAAKGAKEAAVPLSLPRVRPSMQEILEAAERVGKQQAGEFVKTPAIGKTHNLAVRSKKEVDRLKEMEYKVTPIKDLPEMKPYEAQVGEVNIALPGDQTISDMLLESVDGIPVGTTSEGGALFGRGRLADPEDKRAFWASNIGPAELFQKKVTELADLYNTDMVTAYHLAMGQMSNNFAQHMADANLRAIDYSKLNKNKMNAFDRVVSKGYVDPTTKERVTFENWPGIASPEDALQAMKEDPKLRKWFNNRMKTEDVTKKSDLPYGKSIEWAMTEPELRNMEINLTGLSAGRMKPGAELMPDSAHQTYSHDIPGTALGRAPELSPFSISFPDATAFVRDKYREQDFTGTIQKVFPHQVVDEAYLDDMYKYYTQLRKVRGFKKGGAVQSYADGGEITADDLILEERKL